MHICDPRVARFLLIAHTPLNNRRVHSCLKISTWSQLDDNAGPHAPCLRWLFSISDAGIAPAFIIVNAAFAAFLVWAPYTLLVEFSMLLSVPSILLFMWSFVALRVQRPETDRPFLIPGTALMPKLTSTLHAFKDPLVPLYRLAGGLGVAVLIVVIPVAISIAYAAVVLTGAMGGALRAAFQLLPYS